MSLRSTHAVTEGSKSQSLRVAEYSTRCLYHIFFLHCFLTGHVSRFLFWLCEQSSVNIGVLLAPRHAISVPLGMYLQWAAGRCHRWASTAFSTRAELIHPHGRPARASFSTSSSAFPFYRFENPLQSFYFYGIILSSCSFEVCWYKSTPLHLTRRDKFHLYCQEGGDPVPGDWRFHRSKLSQ